MTEPRPTLLVIAEAAERLREADEAVDKLSQALLGADVLQAREHVPPLLDYLKAARGALDTTYRLALDALAQLASPPDDAPRTP